MLTKVTVSNFKMFDKVEIELGGCVVFIGPNNCGKTSALQALALWDIGLKKWLEKRSGKATPEKRPGVTINRRDLIAMPVPDANLLWRDLHVRDVQRPGGKTKTTQNIRVDIVVDGVTEGREWKCGLEFDYANSESIYCRLLRLSESKNPDRMPIPDEAKGVSVAYLPPMSGLAEQEFSKRPGEISYLIGQGRTAEVLRNLCHQIATGEEGAARWGEICKQIDALFGVTIEKPVYIAERSEITMAYRDASNVKLDLSSSGRGLQQTLLLLAYLAANPRSVLVLDEPDAHLEILRQRQIYQLLTDTARRQGSQIVAASHSEVILNEAAERDVVVAFLGKPHRIDDRGSQLRKSLKEIGFDQYYQAEQAGWVLYLEGATDLAILRALAERLNHAAAGVLASPFVHTICNQPQRARAHFRGLREAKKDLVGLVVCDRVDEPLSTTAEFVEYMWKRRELENYICQPETLKAYVEGSGGDWVAGPLFEEAQAERYVRVMKECITDQVPPLALRDRTHKWWIDTKASDDFLDPLFEQFFKKLDLHNLMMKTNYHVLARFVPKEEIDPEVEQVLDLILQVSKRARPRRR